MVIDYSKVDENSLSLVMFIVILLYYYSVLNLLYDSFLIVEIVKGNLNNCYYVIICDFEV